MGQRKRLSSREDGHSQREGEERVLSAPIQTDLAPAGARALPFWTGIARSRQKAAHPGRNPLDGDFADKTLPRKHCSPLRRL